MDHDFERYDMNDLYREETDYADGYDTDGSDYTTDDEEDEMPFGMTKKFPPVMIQTNLP